MLSARLSALGLARLSSRLSSRLCSRRCSRCAVLCCVCSALCWFVCVLVRDCVRLRVLLLVFLFVWPVAVARSVEGVRVCVCVCASIGACLRPSSAQLKRNFSCQEMAAFLGPRGGQKFCFNLAARIIRHRTFVAESVCVALVCVEILLSARSARAPQSRPRRAPSARAVQLRAVCAPWRIGVAA